MKNSSFDKLAENGFITIAETINQKQALMMLSNAGSQEMAISDCYYLKTVKVDSFYESKKHIKQSRSVGPIIVDLYKNRATIIDGTHRWFEARSRGDKTIKAWVGEKALYCLDLTEVKNTDNGDRFQEFVNKSTKAALFMHSWPDPDAIGSVVGIQWLLKRYFNKPSQIYYDGRIDHPKYKAIVDLGFDLKHINDYSDDYDLKILCDTTPAGSQQIEFDIIIDHHNVRLKEFQGLYLNVDAASCCSIVCSLIKRFCSSVDPTIAVALMAGIRDDTQNLTSSNVMDIDLESYQFLFEFVDRSLFKRIECAVYPSSCMQIKIKALDQVKIYDGCAIANLGVISNESRYLISETANDLMYWENVKLAACYAVVGDKIHGFLRSLDELIPMKQICQTLGRSTKSGDGKPGEGSYCHVYETDETDRLRVLLKILLGNSLML